MNYVEKIIRFMQRRNELFPEHLRPLNFNEEDAEDIMSWSKDTAKWVWEELKNTDFGCFCDPFCIKNALFCRECSYGKRHGICDAEEPDNDHYRLKKEVPEIVRQSCSSRRLKKIWEEIENESD